MLLVNCSNRNLDKLQRVQVNLARVICNSERSTSAAWTTVTEPALAASPAADNFKLAKLCYLVTWLLLSNSQATSLIWSAYTVSLACCDHPHRSFCQFHRTTWTLLLVVSLLLLRDFETLFHWTVELLHPLTHLRSVLRHFSLIRHNCTVARTSVLWRDINLLIDWFMQNYKSLHVAVMTASHTDTQATFVIMLALLGSWDKMRT